MDGPSARTTLDYAGKGLAAPAPAWMWKTSVWLAGIAGGVGLSILALFAITAASFLPGWGLVWLGIGGLMSVIAFVFGAAYWAIVATRRQRESARVAAAMLLPLANFLIAWFCAGTGISLMNYHAHRLIIQNEGTTTIDRVDLTAPSLTQSFGPLTPGQVVTVHYPERPRETLTMLVTVGAQSTPYVVAEQMSTTEDWGPRYVKLNGLTGYKNREGRPPP